MRLFGHTFTSGIIKRLRGVVAVEPDVSRSALSRRLCDWLDWRVANGRVQEVSGRKALVELERRGLIELPPVRGCPPRGCPAAAELPWEAPRFSGPLAAVGPVELVAVADAERSSLWQRLLATYHPLGGGRLCGAQQRYLIHSPVVGWLGALAFSAAAWQVATRDQWLGWDAYARRANLPRVVANSRLLLLPTIAVPNLGSHVLALAAARVVADWPARYGVTPCYWKPTSTNTTMPAPSTAPPTGNAWGSPPAAAGKMARWVPRPSMCCPWPRTGRPRCAPA